MTLDGREGPFAVVRVQRVDPDVGVGRPLLLRVPPDRLDLRADVQGGGPVVDQVDVGGGGQVLDQRPVPLLGLPELELGGATLGQVADEAGEQRRPRHLDLGDRQLDRESPAVGPERLHLEVLAEDRRLAGLEEPREPRAVPFAKFGRDQDLGERLARHVLEGVAEHPLRRRVEVHDPAALVHRDDRLERGGQDGAGPELELLPRGLLLATLVFGAGASDRGAERVGGRLERLDLGGRPDALGRVVVEPDEAPPFVADRDRDHDLRQDPFVLQVRAFLLGEVAGEPVELPAPGQDRAPSREPVVVREGRDAAADLGRARSEPLPVQAHPEATVLERDVLEHVDAAGARGRPEPFQHVGERGCPVVALEEPFGREPDRLQDQVATRERLLRVLAGRDVEQDPLPHHRFAVCIAEQLRLVAHPHDATVATDEPVLGREGLAGLVGPLRELEDAVAVLRMQVVHPELRVPQAGSRWEPEQPLVLRADVQGGAHVVDRVLVHDDGQLLDQGPVVRLRLLEAFLGQLALGDVEHHPLEQRVAVVVASDRDRLVPDPHLATLARPHPVFGAEGRLAVLARRPLREDALQVIGVDQGRPELGIPELVGRVAEQLLHLRADVGRGRLAAAVRRVPGVGDRRDAFDQRPVARLRLGEVLFGVLAFGDVVLDTLRQRRAALAVAFDRDRLLVHPDDGAVLADVAVLDHLRFARPVGELRLGQHAVAVLVVDRADPQSRVVDPFLRRVPEDPFHLWAHVEHGRGADRRARIPRGDDGGHLLDERSEAALRLMTGGALTPARPALHDREQREPDREEDERTHGFADLPTQPLVDPRVEGFEQAGRGAEHDEEEHGEQDPQQIPKRRRPAARLPGSVVHVVPEVSALSGIS